MPIYEFECPGCQTRVERLQKFSDAAPVCQKVECECRHQNMLRKISAGAFELKGTGWYKTDFKNK